MKKVILILGLMVFSLQVGAVVGITIQDATKFKLEGGCALKLPAGSVLQVDSNATTNGKFTTVGTVGDSAVITHSEAGRLSVNIEGTVDCQYFIFEYMDENGVYIGTNATIDLFSYGKLSNGANEANSCLLKLDCSSNTFNGLTFDKPAGNEVRYNVRALTNPAPGYWHFANCPAGDNYGGDQYDSDLGDSDGSAVSQGATSWANPYAVELVSFEAIGEKGYVMVNWITECEIDNYKWLLTRSKDKDGEYEQITELYAQEVPSTYIYKDSLIVPGQTYWYKLGDMDTGSKITWHGPVQATPRASLSLSEATISDPSNPSIGKAKLEYSIGEHNLVSLTIYNVSGQLVRTLVDEYKKPGAYTIWWDGKDQKGTKLASGTYFYRLKTDSKLTHKLIRIE